MCRSSASTYTELPNPKFKQETIVLGHILATAMGRTKLVELMPLILVSFGFARLVKCVGEFEQKEPLKK